MDVLLTLLLFAAVVGVVFFVVRVFYERATLQRQCRLALREREEVIDFLNHFCRRLGEVTEMDDAMQLVSHYLCDVLRAESLAIFLVDKTDTTKGTRLRGNAVTGTFPIFNHKTSDIVQSKAKYRLEHLKHEYVELGQGIVGRAAKENSSILISDASVHPDQNEIPPRVSTIMAVPMHVDNRLIGVACAVNCREDGLYFRENDLRMFENLSYQAGLASKLVTIYTERTKQERIHKELQLGQEIQGSLLPAFVPEWGDYRFAAFTQAALEVGGDYYDFVEIDDDRLMVVIADASGKGVPACMLMAMCRSFVRSLVDRYTGLERFLEDMNRRLFHGTDRSHFLTMAVIVVDKKNNVLEYGSAGHTPLLMQLGDGTWRALNPEGPALGLLPDELNPTFDTLSFCCHPGSKFVLFTDGITEALNSDDEEFGLAHLQEVCERNHRTPDEMSDLIVSEVREFAGKVPQSDDQTMVLIARD